MPLVIRMGSFLLMQAAEVLESALVVGMPEGW